MEKLENEIEEKLIITDGNNKTLLNFNELDFGFGDGDYFYNGNETAGQIGFFWNEEKGLKYIDSLYLSLEESDFDFVESIKNQTPDKKLIITLSKEDYRTFLNWIEICNEKINKEQEEEELY